MLIPKLFLTTTIVGRVQKHFPDREHMQAYFKAIFSYLDEPSDNHKSTEAAIQHRREAARRDPVFVLAQDLAVYWNVLGYTGKAWRVPGALAEVPWPENKDWATWQAAQALTRLVQHFPGSVILAALTRLLPRSRKFARNLPRRLRTEGDYLIMELEPPGERKQINNPNPLSPNLPLNSSQRTT